MPAPDQETDAAAGLSGQLQAFGFGQIGIVDLGNDGVHAGVAQSFFRRPEPIIATPRAGQQQPGMIEAELGQTRCKLVGLRGHPEQMSQNFLSSQQGGQKTGDRRQIAHHVMDATAG